MTRHPLFPYQLYLVISEESCTKLNYLAVAEEAIRGGVDIIQFREKNIDTATYFKKAMSLKAITDKYNIPLIINDNLTVAMRVGAFGIHVGRNDVSPIVVREKWHSCRSLGYSIEYLTQLLNEEASAADYFGVSPVFNTKTKKNTVTEWGIEGLRKIRKLTEKPLIAIGNMHLENVSSVMKAGADCIAVVSAICTSDDPRQAAIELKTKILTS
ncbi:thiamine phosphate synthase [Olivibacter sp. SDN3]|uniref:thiamine phosphate synthase n=1 Tax=Olivibacter sp. SDN3 TaxID=2764720 RepID=UPI001651701A|nr:thiamine phosphate synthase [Olivibacter sp. SDN3]QNL49028.1 thiamine phosphate synthase [Olivibacter sp. SDN3]